MRNPNSVSAPQKLTATKYCFACGEEVDNKKMVMFVPRMETYHRDIEDCGNPQSHIYTQIEIAPPFPEYESKPVRCVYADIREEAEKYFDAVLFNDIYKFLGKSASARFNTNQALFLAEYMKKYKFDTANEVLHDIINKAMQAEKEKKLK